jgi:uroporphyrinogen decarboxylase
LGSIDCWHLIPYGTGEELVEAVKATIEKATPGGGYILGSSNSIMPGVNPRNAIAMYEAARQYGVYPLLTRAVSL